jgi:hypothetical protein
MKPIADKDEIGYWLLRGWGKGWRKTEITKKGKTLPNLTYYSSKKTGSKCSDYGWKC